MTKTFIGVREVDEEIFRKFRAKAVEEKLNLGDALNLAMKKWLAEEKKKKDPRNLLKVKPFNFGPGNEKLSEEIDKVLYEK